LWTLLKAVLPTILVFLLVGPLAGYFAIILPIALTAVPGLDGMLQGVAGAIALLPFGALFAYALGYLPALVTGIAVAAMDCVADLGEYRTAAAIVAGAGITLLMLAGAVGLEVPENAEIDLRFAAGAGAAGAIAAGVCAMIAPRRVPVWRAA
jgi:hypothetical protein